MNISKYEFEKETVKREKQSMIDDNIDIDAKYERGYSRVVTETGSYKVSLIKDIFEQENYNLHPEYQRRITWDNKKRSKLIESLIINIPIPPIFLYEYDYDKYEIMDGLQRISTIVDFYNNRFKLSGLTEWAELNGKTYKKLPEKIREGIDRRQLQVITLLKESAASDERADTIKRLVFERLNTGGVKLQAQEIRNAILNGPGNKLCCELADNRYFKKLWDIPTSDEIDAEIEISMDDDLYEKKIDDEKLRRKLERHSLYKRMYDVELVLRFFAMRYLEDFDYALSNFLDDTLVILNNYETEELEKMKELFEVTIKKAYCLFGENAFKYFGDGKWSTPARMVYDPMMLVLSQIDVNCDNSQVEENNEKLKNFYESTVSDEFVLFDGKHQSKEDIKKRAIKLHDFIKELSL